MKRKKEKKMKIKKASKGKTTVLKVLSAILALLIVFAGVTTVITLKGVNENLEKAKSFPDAQCKQIKVENTPDGAWNIYSDDGLKVMQLSDIHLGGGWMSHKKDAMALNAVAAMITAEKPDFVIVTGDITYAVPIFAGTINNKNGAKIFAELMETLGVYWTATFGNHDQEAYGLYDLSEITEFYAQYPHCLMRKGPENIDGYGNQVFNIVKSNGVITRSLFTVDSHSYTKDNPLGIFLKYDNVHENQIEWYRETIEKNNNHNRMKLYSSSDSNFAKENPTAGNIRTSVFLHIPLKEYKDAWVEYVDAGYKDTVNVIHKYGTAGESGEIVFHGHVEDNFFETMQELYSTDTVFCGHDHLNNFSLNYKGIQLTYSPTIDYIAYSGISKLGTQRGCTVIEIGKNGEIEWSAENYYQDKYVSHYEKEEVTMQELGVTE